MLPPLICTDDYERAHGRRPSGRGCWAFEFNTTRQTTIDRAEWAPSGLLYREAKRWAIAMAKARGVEFVAVCT